MQDENESGRPAKRRKQDQTPPSKQGYAQNLTGPKLSLASSKPPNTATIRYEPLRPHIQPTPMTVDLTGEEEHRRADKGLTAVPLVERRVPKYQRERPHKSPPARSGYASNLTGASLNLKGPEGYLSKRSTNRFSTSTNSLATYQAQGTGSSSSVEPDIEGESLEGRPANNIQKRTEPAKKRTKPPPPALALPSRPSPTPAISRPAALSKSSTIVDNSTQDVHTCRPMTDQRVSTLRIKSRPPRKMMMLMERPISRSPAPTESSDSSHNRSRRQQIPDPAQSVVHSQATMRLDAFREHQGRRLEERLNGNQSENSSDDLPSSLADSGINHQMIDSLLSRRTYRDEASAQAEIPHSNLTVKLVDDKAAKPPAHSMEAIITGDAAILATAVRPCLATNTTHRLDIGAEDPQNNSFSSNIVTTNSDLVPAQITTSSIIELSSINEVTLEADLNRQVESISAINNPKKSNRLEKTWSMQGLESSRYQNPSTTGSSHRADKSRSSPPITRSATEANEPSLAVNPSAGAIDRIKAPVDKTEPHSPGSFIAARSKDASPPTHMSSAIMSATAHLRTILKSSCSPRNRVIQDLPSATLEQSNLPLPLAYETRSIEPASSSVAVKESPEPSPPAAALLVNDTPPVEDFHSTTIILGTANPISPAIPNARKHQPREKLANPATRGLSVQMTANRTINALAPAFTGLPTMAPPQPRISTRPGRIPAPDKALEKRSMKEPVEEVPPGGPWSRESFDLFGSWRPPGRDTGIHAVNG